MRRSCDVVAKAGNDYTSRNAGKPNRFLTNHTLVPVTSAESLTPVLP